MIKKILIFFLLLFIQNSILASSMCLADRGIANSEGQAENVSFSNSFKTIWKTTTVNESITIPTTGTGYNYSVDWGDGSMDTNVTGDAIHAYAEIGEYQVSISGIFPQIYFNNSGDKDKILSIEQWGGILWKDMTGAFYGCSSLTINTSDSPDLSNVENLENMFRACSSFNQDISGWNVSNIKNMRNMFRDASSFNQDISIWNVSNVTTMNRMFKGAIEFDQNLALWNIISITDLGSMFTDGAGLSVANYDATLIGWASKSLKNDVNFAAGLSNYCLGEAAKNTLINDYNWIINDSGKDTNCIADFVTIWDTRNTDGLSTGANEIMIPTIGDSYNYTIDWGDGNVDNNVTGNITHTYAVPGIYTLKISGNFPRIYFNNQGDRNKILSVEQWGYIKWKNMRYGFSGCNNLVFNAADSPDLSLVTDMSYMFFFASNFNEDLSNWNISNITNMTDIFKNTALTTQNYDNILIGWASQSVQSNVIFNVDSTKYCLSKTARNKLTLAPNNWVISDGGFDESCKLPFITTWNTTMVNESIHISTAVGEIYNYNIDWGDGNIDNNVTEGITHAYASSGVHTVTISGNFPRIDFYLSNSKNKLLSVEQWGSTEWTSMENAFRLCHNVSINATDSPDLSSATSMKYMFSGSDYFNSNISNWNVANITNMEGVFSYTDNFNQNLNNWNTSNVNIMNSLFKQAKAFNGGISNWNVGKVKDMSYMFKEAIKFNQDISSWNVANVEDMAYMFDDAIVFNADISGWNTGKVTDMKFMFDSASNFNQDISGWNVAMVTDMREMFSEATIFNQDISGWNVSKVEHMNYMFEAAINFNQDLSNWDVSNVTEMSSMFDEALNFDQDLSSWDLSSITSLNRMFDDNSISLANYDATLIGWATDSSGFAGDGIDDVPVNVSFKGGNSTYCKASIARSLLKSSIEKGGYNWSIIDNGLNSNCSESFITKWKTDIANQEINISTAVNLSYNYEIHWGDGNIDSNVTKNITHEYVTPGIYTITIVGNFPRIYFYDSSSKEKLISVEQWGNTVWTSMEDAFRNCTNLNINASDIPNLSSAFSMKNMFRGATNFNSDISSWSTSNIKNMSYMFSDATNFNSDLSSWDVSNVENMIYMFKAAKKFDQNLSNWDLSNISQLGGLFFNCSLSILNYDAILTGWATDSSGFPNDGIDDIPEDITFHGGYSKYCASLEARELLEKTINDGGYNWSITDGGNGCQIVPFITNWKTTTSNEEIHISTAPGTVYNYNIDWGDGTYNSNVTGDTSHIYIDSGEHTVTITGDFPSIYFKTSRTKEKLTSVKQWGITIWKDMTSAFEGCTNLTINTTDTPNFSSLSSTAYMFKDCTSLEGDFSNWDVSTIKTMEYMFSNIKSFNEDLSNWDVSNVTVLANMFNGCANFNQDLSKWNVSNVKFMNGMFSECLSFNQDLSNWDLSNISSMEFMLNNTAMSIRNYDATLIGWATDNSGVLGDKIDDIPSNNYFDASNSNYCLSEEARELLEKTINDGGYNWIITDAGKKCNLLISLKVYLQGAYTNPNLGEESLMRDDLRVAGGVYGTTSPYGDGVIISESVGTDAVGSNSMVDWIYVELRDATDDSIVIAGKSAVLQRDGDIVDVAEDRVTPLTFEGVTSGNYYVVIKHRNHISIRSASTIALSSSTTTINFSNDASLVSGGANALIDMGDGIYAMPSGDYDGNGQIQTNDASVVISKLGTSGYHKADMDMNGQIQTTDINELININIGKGAQF